MPVNGAKRRPATPAQASSSARSLPGNGERRLAELDTPTAGAVFFSPAPVVTVNVCNPAETLSPVVLRNELPEAKIRAPPRAQLSSLHPDRINVNPERH